MRRWQVGPDRRLREVCGRVGQRANPVLSFEPPTHDDLLATVNGTPNSSAGRPQPPNPTFAADVFRTPDLKAQAATTGPVTNPERATIPAVPASQVVG